MNIVMLVCLLTTGKYLEHTDKKISSDFMNDAFANLENYEAN